MKKLFSLIIVLSLSVSYINAQVINYQKTLSDALVLAAKANKPVFICVVPPSPPRQDVPANIPANVHFANASAFSAKNVVDFYNKNFICYKVSLTDSAGITLKDHYHLTFFPNYFFLDPQGQILYKGEIFNPIPEKFISLAGQALERLATGKTISYYANMDKQGTITADQLKAYTNLREELGLFDNADLADKYVNFLTTKSFDDYNTVLFILKTGPYAYGKAYSLVHTNKKLIDSIYKKEGAAVSAMLNGRTIENTLNQAIKNKDVAMARKAASFTGASWGKNYVQGNKAAASDMLTYYESVKDTALYFSQASSYYDKYYMTISADSAKKPYQKTLNNFNKPINNRVTHNKDNITTEITQTMRGRLGAPGSAVAVTLNNAAKSFYTLGTYNANNLTKALIWCKRAIEIQPKADFYDTMAHIVYRLNFHDEAIIDQTKAVEMAVNELHSKTEQDYFKDELNKMKAYKL